MAVKTSSPWWLSVGFGLGLAFVFMGERALGHLDTGRLVLTSLGLLLMVSATGVRVWSMLGASGDSRRVERTSLICYGGAFLALFLYFLTTDTGVGMLDIETDPSIVKFRTVMQVLFSIVLCASLLPLIMIEASLGVSQRSRLVVRDEKSDDANVEAFRVREMAWSGLTIALAMSFLMVTCNIAEQRNIRVDVSYFKTSSPGSATVNMTNSLNDELRVLLFFPEVNDVAEEVNSYFEALAAQSSMVTIERYDRMVSPDLAKKYKANADGTVVLVRGDQSEKFTVKTDMKVARRKELRELDSKVQRSLMKVIRAKRVAYMTVGHGELNDPSSAGPLAGKNPFTKSTLIKQLLGTLNYEVKNYDGYGKPVPDDCRILLILAPRTALMPEELRAIDDYLARGGGALIALDPNGDAGLGVLEGRLGIKFNKTPLADDKEFMVRTRTRADHRMLLTNQFSSHAAVTTLSRGRARSGILLINPGSFDDAPFTVSPPPKRTYVVRSMTTSFRDANNNLTRDPGEKAQRHNVIAAIEAAKPSEADANGEKQQKHGMRVLAFADGDLFSDGLVGQIPLIKSLVEDNIKWIGGEEEFAGETVSEKDVRIEHTKNQDVLWFYGSMVGAPIFVLAFGLLAVVRRRRRTSRRAS